MVDKKILKIIKKWVCENDIWDFSPEMKEIYKQEISNYKHLPGRGINPSSLEEVETNIKKFFPRHFFKIQHSLYDLVSWGYHFFEDGTVTMIDIGCGPGTASLAVLDFYFQLISAYSTENIEFPFIKPLKFNFILTDVSSHCLLKATYLITKYLQHIVKQYDFTEDYLQIHPIIVTFQGEYPDVIPQIKAVLEYTGKANLLCFSNVLVQLTEKLKCEDADCILCENENTKKCKANKKIIKSLNQLEELKSDDDSYCQVIIIQEKGHWNLIQQILPGDHLSCNLVNMTQKNYNTDFSDASYTASYGRALYHYGKVNK